MPSLYMPRVRDTTAHAAEHAIDRNFAQVPVAAQSDATNIQPLQIGAVNDPAESEADTVADLVARGSNVSAGGHGIHSGEPAALQRKCDCGGTCSTCQEEAPGAASRILRKSTGAHGLANLRAPVAVERYVAGLDGRGVALPDATRGMFERRLGQDFSRVRIHADTAANTAAGQVAARAFTAGRHIVFAAGQYAPHAAAGRHLLAHELAHVVQQSASPVGAAATTIRRMPWGGCPPGTRLSGNRPFRYAAAEFAAVAYYKTVRGGNCVATNINPFETIDCAGAAGKAFERDFRSGKDPQRRRPVLPADKVPAPSEPGAGVLDEFGGHATQTTFAALRPDIIDFTSREMYDVTTTNLASAKKAKVAGYIKLAEAITKHHWSAGHTLPAPPPFWLNFKFRPRESICFGPTDLGGRPGVIAYEVIGDEKQRKKDKKEDEEAKRKREEKKRKQEERKRKREEKKRERERKKQEKKREKKPKEKKSTKKERKGEEPEAPAPSGGNIGFGIGFLSSGGGAYNAGVGVSIMSNGHSYGTVSAGVVYDSDGVAVGSVSAGAASSSTGVGLGTAAAGLAEDATSAGAGAGAAGRVSGSTSAGAGTLTAGTSKDDLTASAGVISKGHTEGRVGAVAGAIGTAEPDDEHGAAEQGGKAPAAQQQEGTRTAPGPAGQPGGAPGATPQPAEGGASESPATQGVSPAGAGKQGDAAAGGKQSRTTASGSKHGLSIPGVPAGQTDHAVEQASKIEEMIRRARPAQRALMNYLAQVSGDGQYVVPAATWVTTILSATDQIKDDDLAYLITLTWQPGHTTPEQLKKDIAEALRRRQAAAAPPTPADPTSTPQKPGTPPPPAGGPQKSTIPTHDPKVKHAVDKKTKPQVRPAASGEPDKDAPKESDHDYALGLYKRAVEYDGWNSFSTGIVIYRDTPEPHAMVLYLKIHSQGKEQRWTGDVFGTIEKDGGQSVVHVQSSGILVSTDKKVLPAGLLNGKKLSLGST